MCGGGWRPTCSNPRRADKTKQELFSHSGIALFITLFINLSRRVREGYYCVLLTTNAPVIENICAGRVDSGSPVCWRWVCGVRTREKKDMEGRRQETWTSRSDPMSLVRDDIHLACVLECVSVCVSEGCKEVSTSLNPPSSEEHVLASVSDLSPARQ